MGIIDKKEVQSAFKKEAGSLINKIEKELNRLNNDPRSKIHDSRIFRLFRYAHTLQGISGTCGYYKIEETAKSIAEIFRAAQDGKLEISPEDKVTVRKKLKACEELLKRSMRNNELRTTNN